MRNSRGPQIWLWNAKGVPSKEFDSIGGALNPCVNGSQVNLTTKNMGEHSSVQEYPRPIDSTIAFLDTDDIDVNVNESDADKEFLDETMEGCNRFGCRRPCGRRRRSSSGLHH